MARFIGLSQIAANNAAGTRLNITKKLVLWSVLILQLGFIGCIWLLQLSRNQEQQLTETAAARVHFVQQERLQQPQSHKKRCMQRENVNQYQRDFYQLKLSNHSVDYALPAYAELEQQTALWCYAEGTVNQTQQQLLNELDYLLAPPQCSCQSGWHGRDCGQPEIIWRALMTHSRSSRRPLKLREASANRLKRLYYMISLGDWQLINLELLQLQLRTLASVVDYYLIYYYVNASWQHQQQRRLERQLQAQLNGNFVLHACTNRRNCSSANAYAHLRQQLWTQCGMQLAPTDLLLYGDAETVYAPAALKFLKYYAEDVLPLRFRLKHNVYGFYWQHPQRTRLSGVISSLLHLHAAQLNLQRLEQQASHTLGDLNHYGGWSCELCLSPEQLLHMLQTKANVSHVHMPQTARIDATYIQQLMGNGLQLDGSTQLLRMRQQHEKYYAPTTALLQSQEYAQLLVNLYDVDVLNDLQLDED
ncbi:CG31849, partial [Drosophila busckii]